MFIFNYGILTTIDKNQDAVGGLITRSYGNVDLTLSGYEQNSEGLFYKLNNSMIRKVKEIHGVKGVEPNFYNADSYVSIEKSNVNSNYLDELKRIDSSYNKEYPLLVRGYNDKLLKNIDSFIGEGKNILNSKSDKYKQVLLVNNCYSRVTNSFKGKVMNNVNVGDVIDVKLPVIRNGIENHETFKVQVAGIMKEIYIANQDGEPQFKGGHVILKEGDYKELTNQLDYNNLFVMVEKGKLDSVEKDLSKIVENHSFTLIGGKNRENNGMASYFEPEDRLNVVYQCVIILMLSVNIIFIVRSNIIARKKELSVLRAIGMSTKNIKKIIMIESTLYGVISSIISSIVATILYNRQITEINNISLEGGYTKMLEHDIPFTYIIVFALITVIMCIISVYFSKDKIEKLSIVDGISENS
jgi:putative ABC transport system permease protein